MRWLYNRKVGTRLAFLAAAALGGVACVTAVSLSAMGRVEINGPLYDQIVADKDLLADILPPPAYIIESFLNAHALADAEEPTVVEALVERASKLTEEYKARQQHWASVLEPGDIRDILTKDSAEPALEFYRIRDAQLIPLVRAGKLDEARALVDSTLKPLYETHRDTIDTLVGLTNERSQQIESNAAATVGSSHMWVWTTVGIASVAVAGIALLIARSVTGPIRRISRTVEGMAKGDLRTSTDLQQRDELGALATSLDRSIEAVRGTIEEVAQASQRVAAAATQIAASSEEMTAGLREQDEQTGRVASAIEEMASSVAEVAHKGSEASAAAESSRAVASDGGQIVGKTVDEMAGIAQQVEASAEVVTDLGKKSESIGRIIGVINDIADQTNLLALNAAIEAARAGEHGRGFAVVADEVRKLAERTTQATTEVAGSIRQIQEGTGEAVRNIQTGSERASRGVELAQSAGLALNKIVESSAGLRSMVDGIAASASEQSIVSKELARNVESIAAVTRQSTTAAAEAAQAASALATEAENLSSLVSRFQV